MVFRIVLPVVFVLAAAPAVADRIEGQARVAHVTVFPQGAAIRWNVDLAAAPGAHELILPDLPQGIDPSSLRIEAEGARIGAVALQSGRALPSDTPEPAAVTEARARLTTARDALVDFEAGIAARQAAAQAWQERAGITRDLMRGDARVAAVDLQAMVDQAGGMVTDYLARAAAETREADLMANRRDEVQRAVQRAEEHLAAVIDENAGHETLVVALETTGQPARLTLTGFTDAASWAPDYDLRLDRASGQMVLERGLVVQQSSGTDWQDVTLTLSTARPSDQSTATEVPSWLPRIAQPSSPVVRRSAPMEMADMEAGGYVAPVVDVEPVIMESAALASIGMTVAYDYPSPVTIRNDADSLRLKLDQTSIQTEVLAEAAPRYDITAYLLAETTNTTGEPILPGNATLYLDGALVGRTMLDLIAPDDDLHIGFGPLDGITAELRVPEETEGDRGIIRRSNQLIQTETLIVRNLTDQEWPLRVVDRIPVSTQEDLTVKWTADPAPSETDPDGRRGVLYWQAPLAAGETREITLRTELGWPDGQELYR